MTALALCLFLVAFASVAWQAHRRADAAPAPLWVGGWLLLLASALPEIAHSQTGETPLLTHFAGPFLPALLLGGAFAYAGRAVPAWLLPMATGVGFLRLGLAAAGQGMIGQAVAIGVEPALCWGAAEMARRPPPGGGFLSGAQRALPWTFLGVAILEVVTAVNSMRGGGLTSPVVLIWALTACATLAVQMRATADLAHQRRLRDHAELELRVEERTAELAAVVSKLEKEIAARMGVEQKLRASQERYRIVSGLSSDLSFAFRVGEDGSLIGEWSTDAVERITGYAPHEADGLGWRALMHPEDWEPTREHMYAAAAGAERAFESRIVTKQQEVRWLSWRLAGVRSETDGVLRVVGAVRDITEHKHEEEEKRRLELRMQEAQKLESLGVLAGGIAHDFNNLLSVILGNAKLGVSELPSNSPVAVRLGRIHAAAQHAAGLTRQILAYSGKTAMTLEGLNLSQLVAELLDLLRASVSKKCTIQVDLSPDLPPVAGDLTQARQVVMNLVINAAEALERRPGHVTIRTGSLEIDAAALEGAYGTPDLEPGCYVFLEVSDSGVGMPPAKHPRIFEPFFTTKFSGRGLGLAAVLGIVRQHGGLIQVESEPGHGSTFRVLLPPAHTVVASVSPSLSRSPHPAPAARGTVLVVDDEAAVLELASEILERAGFRVRQARGGLEAVTRFDREAAEIDAVVLDLTMPDVDGEETFRALRALRADIPVILTTGYNEDFTAEHLRTGELSGFLSKPYEPQALIDAVRQALER